MSPARRSDPAGGGGALSIGALSRATRVPVETLRTWERRYGAPMPVRKPSGQRVYTAQAVEHMRRVVRLLALGHTNREIATMLEISVRTVEVHRFNLMRRLEVRNVAQLLRRALQMGLLSKSFGFGSK